MRQITDMETWLLDNGDRVFDFCVYRRLFTPYEVEQAYIDETETGDSHRGYIEEAIDLGGGEWFLGIREVFCDNNVSQSVRYYRLSEIRLSYREHKGEDECDDEEERN